MDMLLSPSHDTHILQSLMLPCVVLSSNTWKGRARDVDETIGNLVRERDAMPSRHIMSALSRGDVFPYGLLANSRPVASLTSVLTPSLASLLSTPASLRDQQMKDCTLLLLLTCITTASLIAPAHCSYISAQHVSRCTILLLLWRPGSR